MRDDDSDELVVICTPLHWHKAHFTDDRTGGCARCLIPIRWRPHNPEPSTKLCIRCVMDTIEPGVPIRYTARTAAEFATFLRRN